MPATQPTTSHSNRPQPRRDALERLFVRWVASTVVFFLVAIMVAVYVHGALQAQTARLDTLESLVISLETRLADLESATRAPGAAPPQPATAVPPDNAPQSATIPSAGQPSVKQPLATTTPADASLPTESDIASALDAVMPAQPTSPIDVRNAETAHAFVDQALRQVTKASWPGPTWLRLAVLARLLGRDADAEILARRAAAAREPLTLYTEVCIRALLAHREFLDALTAARQLYEQNGESPTARVLLVATLVNNDQPDLADQVLDGWNDPAALAPYDRLLLARALWTLEKWDQLAAALPKRPAVPPALVAEWSFLRAVPLARDGRAVEALAMLDYLAAHQQAAAQGPAYDVNPAWPIPQPTVYKVQVGRGAALLEAHNFNHARDTLLQAAKLEPGLPDAYYHLGLLEQRAGRPNDARTHLLTAVACSARMAPAWEALATLALNSAQVSEALDDLHNVVEINPRRASAHFLRAIAHAKLSQRTAAAEALQEAFRLDRSYVDQAKQAEVLLRLFSPAQLDELASRG